MIMHSCVDFYDQFATCKVKQTILETLSGCFASQCVTLLLKVYMNGNSSDIVITVLIVSYAVIQNCRLTYRYVINHDSNYSSE